MVAVMKRGVIESRQGSENEPCMVESDSTSVTTRPSCGESCICEKSYHEETCDNLEFQNKALHEEGCSSIHNRDQSHRYNRKKTESAQFLDAVGESSLGIDEIEIVDSIDDDSQDEEDEGAFEIQANTIPPKMYYWRVHVKTERQLLVPFTILPNSSWFQRDSIPDELNYQGIERVGLEITKCGVQRGNPVILHRKAWLEVSDSRHRYGKHLRIYYYHWCSLGYPTNNFFHWLDGKGEAEGMPVPDLPECPRKVLEADTVLYITDPAITESYSLSIVTTRSSGKARILDANGEMVKTGAEGWIFVLRDNVMYGTRKVAALTANSKQRFHHSSFFGGKAVSAAGIIVTDDEGFLTQVRPHSGHYRPGEQDVQRCLCYLYARGVDLDTFEVDMQQIFRISRQKESTDDVHAKNKPMCGTKKKEKKNCLYMRSASYTAYFLSHKARAIKEGVFQDIEMRQCLELDSSIESFGISACSTCPHNVNNSIRGPSDRVAASKMKMFPKFCGFDSCFLVLNLLARLRDRN